MKDNLTRRAALGAVGTAGLAALAATALIPSRAAAAEKHPKIRAALADLRDAKDELEKADTDFGGHKKDAIAAIEDRHRSAQDLHRKRLTTTVPRPTAFGPGRRLTRPARADFVFTSPCPAAALPSPALRRHSGSGLSRNDRERPRGRPAAATARPSRDRRRGPCRRSARR